jgi:hypothetical protein
MSHETTPLRHDLPLALGRTIPSAAPSRTHTGGQPVRWALVHRVRAEIAAGRYETADKWAVVVERLLGAL